jgi:hypothetical protein
VIFGAIKNHPEETLRWLEALPSDGNRDTLLEGALTAHSKWTAPDASLEDSQRMLAAMATLPADAQERVVRNLGARQAERTNLEEVHAWVERLPDAALRAAAIVAFAQNALSRRTQEKEQLMAEFSRVEERDAMLRGIASWEADFAPRTAAELALEIADPQQRHDALDDFVIGWLHGDPPAARQWLTNSARIPAEWSDAWLAEAERTR